MLDIAVLVQKLEAAKVSDKANRNTNASYVANVSLSEKERLPGGLVLAFGLELSAHPQVARISVRGTATLSGTEEEVQEVLAPPNGKGPPAVLQRIYERVYGSIYLLATSIDVPEPLPNLLAKEGE